MVAIHKYANQWSPMKFQTQIPITPKKLRQLKFRNKKLNLLNNIMQVESNQLLAVNQAKVCRQRHPTPNTETINPLKLLQQAEALQHIWFFQKIELMKMVMVHKVRLIMIKDRQKLILKTF